MSSWLWVRDGETKVDSSQLVSAALDGQKASSLLIDAQVMLQGGAFFTAPLLGSEQWVELMESTLGGEYLALVAELRPLAAAVAQSAGQMATTAGQFATWLGQAALIYASAESGAAQLAALTVALGGTSSLSTPPSTVAGYARLAGDYLSQFLHRSQEAPTLGLEGQAHMQNLAQQLAGGGPGGFTAVAAGAALTWGRVGDLFSSKREGVVIVGPDGTARWSTRSLFMLSTFLPISSSEPAKTKSGRTRDAVRLLTDIRLSSPVSADRANPAKSVLSGFEVLPKTVTPMRASTLLSRIEKSRAASDVGQIQIMKHVNRAGTTSWSVVLSGTQSWLPGAGNPQDMESNLQVVAGQVSDQEVAAAAAMEMAGIRPGDPVEIVGHSQGGAVALALATNPALSKQYNFVSVLTAGSPTGTLRSTRTLPVLNLENLADPVPALDAAASRRGKNTVTAYFDPREIGLNKKLTAHSLGTYVEALRQVEVREGLDPMTKSIEEWQDKRIENMGFTDETASEVIYFDTTRVR